LDFEKKSKQRRKMKPHRVLGNPSPSRVKFGERTVESYFRALFGCPEPESPLTPVNRLKPITRWIKEKWPDEEEAKCP